MGHRPLKELLIGSNVLQALLVSLCCLPIFLLAAVSYNKIYEEETNQVLERKQAIAFLASAILDERLDAQVDLAVSLASRPVLIQEIKKGQWAAAIGVLTNIPLKFPIVERIILYDPSGTIKATVPSGLNVIGESRTNKEWYKQVLSHWRPYVSNIYERGSKPIKNVISVLVPVEDDNANGEVLGILQLQISVKTFSAWVKDFHSRPGEIIYVLDRHGQVVYHPRFDSEKKIVNLSSFSLVRELMRGRQGVKIHYSLIEKGWHIAAYRTVGGYGWGVVVTQPVQEAFLARDRKLRGVIVFYGIGLLLMGGIATLLFYGLRKQKEVRDKIRQLSLAVEQSPMSVVITDVQGNIEYVNAKFSTLTGYSFSEAIGKNPSILKSGEQPWKFYKNLWDTILSGKEWRGEFHNKKKNGVLYWELASISPIKEPQGRITHFVAVKEDITAAKIREERLLYLTERFNLAKGAAQIGIWDWDVVNNIMVWDAQMYKLYGINKKRFKGGVEDWKERLYREDSVRVEREVQDALSGHKDFDTEFRVQWPDGSIHYIKANALVTRDPNGKAVRMTGINIDITPRKEAEVKAAEAINIKSEFISMVSHELRTPLTIIKESVSLVYDGIAGSINADQKDFLSTAKNNVDRLSRLINDVLDYQKLEAHYIKFQMAEQSINDVVKEAGEGFKIPMQKKGLDLKFHLQEGLPPVNCDRDKIIQVLTNLMDNAMKFTEKGTIHLMTEILGDNAVKVSVKDEGRGIKEEDQGKLFKAFSQLLTEVGRKTGGTGLGLALCRKIIEEQNGQIGVSSAWGKGATFYFILPIKERRISRGTLA